MSAPPHADPGAGVFETMLVLAGQPVQLDAHLERLAISLAALYGALLPAEAGDAVVDRAAGIECGKLRLTVVPRAGRMELDVTADEIDPACVFPSWERGAALQSFVVAGGLGNHKWADRRLLDCLASATPAGALPLLVETDGSVLEASRASLFAVIGERLVTSPNDGRILPSIARRQVIEVARASGVKTREETLALAGLRSGEAFLVGSVRGVEPVRSLDGADLEPPGEISELVADGLERLWLAPREPVAAGAGGPRAGRRGH
jgi:para-aminobenzoate synthetase / 4-amino-4-deoxychorismate lyase